MPKFILCSDLHLRDDVPRCRLETKDEWYETQRKQLEFIAEQAHNDTDIKMIKKLPIVITGDIFNKSNVSDYLKNILIIVFYDIMVKLLAGQHDLLGNTFDNILSSSLGVLISGSHTNFEDPYVIGKFAHYGQDFKGRDTGLYFLHTLIFEDEKSIPPNVKAMTAEQALEKYPDAKWIFSGDNHHGFHYQKNGRHVIVPGCLNRQASNFKDYEPCIWYVDTDDEIVERIPVPDDVNMVTDDHIVRGKEKNSKVRAFAEIAKTKGELTLDYLLNVKDEMDNSDLSDGVKRVTRELIDI